GNMVLLHSVPLAGLAPGTYHYRIRSSDAAGNVAVSQDLTFTTQGDTTPPVISGVAATAITSNSATIVWDTDEPADSQVDYGTSTTYGSSTPLDPNLVFSHSVVLSGLTSGALYHYRIRSTDAAGNLAVSPDLTFVASPAGNNNPPVISLVAVASITQTTA